MKKAISLFLAMLLFLSLLGSVAAAEEPVTLQLWHRWSGANEAALVDVIAAFEEANPNIKIEVTAKPGEYIELLQKMIADLAAGIDPPDLFVGGYNLLNYISTEMEPVPVNELAPSEEAYAAFTDKFEDTILALAQAGGVQVGVPYAMSNIVTFYNTELIEEAGLTEADIPATWDDMFTAGAQIASGTGKYAVGMQKVDTWPDLGIIYSNGGQLLSEDGTKVAFNNPEAAEALTMWQNLHLEGLAPICTDDELFASFVAGDVAMYVASVMKLNTLKDSSSFTVGTAQCPAFTGKDKKLPAGGAAIISFTGDDQAKRDACWTFMDFATEPEPMTTFTQTGYLCVTKADVPVAEGQQPAYDQIPYAVQWTAWPGGSIGLEIDKLYLNTRTEIIHGDIDALEALDKLADTCNALLD